MSQIKCNSELTLCQSLWQLSVCFPTELYPKLDWHLPQPWYPLPPQISSCPKLNCCPRMFFVSTRPKHAFALGFWLTSTLQRSIPGQLEPSVNSLFSALDDTCLPAFRISALYSRTVTLSGCCMYIGKEHSIAKRLQSYSFWSGHSFWNESWTVISFLESVLLLVKCPTYHLLGGGYEVMHIKNFFFLFLLKRTVSLLPWWKSSN